MKFITLASSLALIAGSVLGIDSKTVVCTPVEVVNSNILFAANNNTLYKYTIPDLSLQLTSSGELLCQPGSIQGSNVVFAQDLSNTNSIAYTTSTLVPTKSNSPAPVTVPYYITYGGGSVSDGDDKYTYSNGVLTHTNKGAVVETLNLGTTDNVAAYISFDVDVQNRIHLATRTSQGRGGSELTYYTITRSPLALVRCGVKLPNTVLSGCPVAANQCAVPVTLDFKIQNDIVTYLWSIVKGESDFEVTAVSYDAKCNVLNSVPLGSTLQPVSRCSAVVAPGCGASTSAPTTSAPSTSTTSAPATSAAPTTTSAPATSATPTTNAPSTGLPVCGANQNLSGDNLASPARKVLASSSCENQNLSGDNNASPARRFRNTVCSGHGQCDANKVCQCASGFEGANCENACIPASTTTSAPSTTKAPTSAPVTTTVAPTTTNAPTTKAPSQNESGENTAREDASSASAVVAGAIGAAAVAAAALL
ncbi:mys [Acrasis kona]|uniref:Mys n=1 Tax=Acrasis kona TaxID=1008807 RepID=A0AAW2YSK5_9EUKA